MNELIAPKLPFDMKPRAREAVRDLKLQQFVGNATHLKDSQRGGIFGRDFGPDYDDLRTVARDTKQHALDHLDELLERFIASAEKSGATVHAAATAADACGIALDIARAHGATSCVKSKSMVTEEIGLLPAFEAAGIKTLETDLGEFILQIDGDAPSHIVTPMIHKDRVATAKSFVRELGARYTEDPTELTMIAREHMRGLYRAADLGVSGANFLLADEGAAVMHTAQRIAQAIAHTFHPPGLTLLQANGKEGEQTVFHFHLHLLPRHANDGVGLQWPRKEPGMPTLMDYAQRLSAQLASGQGVGA